MSSKTVDRRDFMKTLLGGISVATLDWGSLPRGKDAKGDDDRYDAVIIGSGLGGLSCAAAFARQGFKPLVVEMHEKPGGYATTFHRPGGFVFDVSLHSTSVGERNGLHNLISGFPEITDVEFLPHPNLYRVMYPDYDIRVPQKDVAGYIKLLSSHFPEEQQGIQGLLDEMKGVTSDVGRLSSARGQLDMSRFPADFPSLFKCANKTWGEMVDGWIKNPKLRTVVSTLWAYYGLPPSKLAALYYAMPTFGYLQQGGYYPRGRSQKISNALVKFIEDRGGKVLLNTRVAGILSKDHAAYGVKTTGGQELLGRVVISNANAYDTFHALVKEGDLLKEYLHQMDQFSVSLSSFQIFLGLKEDLVGKAGLRDTEIFVEPDYDIENSYLAALNANMDNCGYVVTLYDNIYKGYSPERKNTLTIMILQGYDHWKEYQPDYVKGKKAAYRAEKERMAEILIKKVERTLLPGLSSAIEVKEIGTPLTNIRYTGNYRGAIYGWDQTLNNSGQRRLPHTTPVKNLYLSGAWTSPGHGFGGVIGSGLECFGEVMKSW
jgi:all-trans-retinol 13,14-reductase